MNQITRTFKNSIVIIRHNPETAWASVHVEPWPLENPENIYLTRSIRIPADRVEDVARFFEAVRENGQGSSVFDLLEGELDKNHSLRLRWDDFCDEFHIDGPCFWVVGRPAGYEVIETYSCVEWSLPEGSKDFWVAGYFSTPEAAEKWAEEV